MTEVLTNLPRPDFDPDDPASVEHYRAEIERWQRETCGNFDLLHALLPLAVAGWIDRVRDEPWKRRTERLDRLRAFSTPGRRAGERLACDGFNEALLVRVPGETSKEFNRLAEALAIMAFVPGGVRCFGWHWEERDERCRRER